MNSAWEKNIPFLLSYLGAYQGWMDPKLAVPEELFRDGRSDRKHPEFVRDLHDQTQMEPPVVPAMNFRRDLNGLNTPSKDGNVYQVPSMEYDAKARWTAEDKKEAHKRPTSTKDRFTCYLDCQNNKYHNLKTYNSLLRSWVNLIIWFHRCLSTLIQT